MKFNHLKHMSIIAASLLAALGGCSQNNAGDGGNSGTGNDGVKSTGSGTSGDKRRIAAILMQEDQFFRLNELGMKDAAKKNNIELLTGSAAGALDKEINLVDTYAGRGVQAILVSPLNPKGSSPALKRAGEKGAKIITYNNVLEQPFVACGLRSDDVALGASTGKVVREYIQKKLGGKAKIAVLQYVALLADVGPLRPNGFKSEIKKLPGAQIVATQDAWLAPEAERVATDILNAHPDINVIWAANEGGTVGAVTAVKNAGKAGKVMVFGTDMSEQIAGFLLSPDNILQAVTGQKPYEMGYQAVESAVKVLDGQKIQKQQILPGVLFTRDKPEAVKAFQQQVQKLAQ